MLRRTIVLTTFVSGAAYCGGCGLPRKELLARIDAALDTAKAYLVNRQAPDGTWRSDVYGCFRDGLSLTPHVCAVLMATAESDMVARSALRAGQRYLVWEAGRLADDDEEVCLTFPVYTAAMACCVLALGDADAARQRAQRRWLRVVRAHQFSETLGWTPADPSFGGWGYSVRAPRRQGTGDTANAEANISATVFAVAALRMGGVPAHDQVFCDILDFAQRCQNFRDDPSQHDVAYDDGGFFFSPTDAARNKAGSAGTDRWEHERFHSYGSATADGLRIMLRCGFGPATARVVAARRWLERNFVADHNPGRFNPDREVLRDATYYYYCWSVSHAFMALGVRQWDSPTGRVEWAELLAEELLHRQTSDGAWSNGFTDTKEDDPLVATPFAVAALTICREMMTVGARTDSRTSMR